MLSSNLFSSENMKKSATFVSGFLSGITVSYLYCKLALRKPSFKFVSSKDSKSKSTSSLPSTTTTTTTATATTDSCKIGEKCNIESTTSSDDPNVALN